MYPTVRWSTPFTKTWKQCKRPSDNRWMDEDAVYMYYETLAVVQSLSHVPLFATLPRLPLQTPLPKEFSRRDYSSRLPLPFPRDLTYLGIEPTSPSWQADCLQRSHQGRPMECYSAIKGMKYCHLQQQGRYNSKQIKKEKCCMISFIDS